MSKTVNHEVLGEGHIVIKADDHDVYSDALFPSSELAQQFIDANKIEGVRICPAKRTITTQIEIDD